MSATTPKIRNPLIHNGVSQYERLLDALVPENFNIDDRSLKDLVVAAYQYSNLFHYFNEENDWDGDWRCFWEVETLTFLAVLAEIDIDILLQQYNELEIGFADDIEEGAGGPSDPGGEAITNYYDLTKFIFELSQQINKAFKELPSSLALKQEIEALIDKKSPIDNENLIDAFRLLISIHKSVYFEEHQQNLPLDLYSDFFSPVWGIPDSTSFEAIKFTTNFDRATLRKLFRDFYQVIVKIRQRANYWFDKLIEEPQLHQPHIALFLTFLRLFRHAQNSLNILTKKHLDFFYEQVLCILRKKEVPDEVFILFELAKGFEEYLVEEGTELLAGKDINGQPLLFEAIEDWVVRKAQVKEIKNTYIDVRSEGSGSIIANPDVNLAYKAKEILPNESATSWRSVGDDEDLPNGGLGFAIASPQLILREGKRVLDVKMYVESNGITLSDNMVELLESSNYNIYLSSEEEWIKAIFDENLPIASNVSQSYEEVVFNVATTVDSTSRQLEMIHFRIVLEKDELPITKLGEELAVEAGFNLEWPIIKILFAAKGENKKAAGQLYDIYKKLNVTEIKLAVDVIGIRENLIIQSDQGVFDGTQKIYPFGTLPEVGHHFYIGSTEIFQKALDELIVQFDWIVDPNFNFDTYYQEYKNVNINTAHPKLEINFIDRADDQTININRIERRSALEEDRTISVKIENITFQVLNNVDIFISSISNPSTGLTAITEVDYQQGIYTFILPDGFEPLDSVLIFNAADNSYEPIAVPIESNGTLTGEFELVLFPLKLEYLDFIDPDTQSSIVEGLVSDMYGNPLSGVIVNGAISDTTPFGEPNFAIEGLSEIPSNLNFSKSGYSTENIATNGFSIIDVNLFPDAAIKVIPPLGEGEFVNTINGKIVGPNQEALSDIFIIAIGQEGGQEFEILKTKTDQEGNYSLLGIENAIRLAISYEYYEIPGYEVLNNEFRDIINLQIYPVQVDKSIPDFPINVSGNVTDYSGAPLSGVTIRSNNAVLGITDVDGNFGPFANIPSNSLLIFEKEGFINSRLVLEGNTDVSISLGRENVPDPINIVDSSLDNAINFNVFDHQGNRLTGNVTFLNKENEEITPVIPDNGFPFIITPGIVSETITVVHPMYPPVKVEGLSANKIVDVTFLDFYEPYTSIDSNPEGQISGTIINRQGQTVANASVRIIGEGIYYEVKTGSNGQFIILLPDGNTGPLTAQASYELNGIRQYSFLSPAGEDINGKDITLVGNYLSKSRSFSGRLTGRVIQLTDGRDIIPINDVYVRAGNRETRTDLLGNFVLTGITPNTSTISFQHPLYQGFTLAIEDDYELLVILFPIVSKHIFTGQVTDIFQSPLPQVSISLIDEGIDNESFSLGTSDPNGFYRIGVNISPQNNATLFFSQQSYENTELILPPDPIVNKTLSKLNVRLFFGDVQLLPLIDPFDKNINTQFSVNINALNLVRDIRTQNFTKYDPTLKRGFIKLTLKNNDFLHKVYPKVLIWHTLQMRGGDVTIPDNSTGGENTTIKKLPNSPFTPASNGISVSYKSEQSILIKNEGIDQYFQLLPFNGYKEIHLSEEDINGFIPNTDLLAVYPYRSSESMMDFASGNLYIGLSDLKPGSTLSLLVQAVEGSELEPDLQPPDIRWSYLTKENNWVAFETKDILKDTTNGLTRSGMVQLQVPKTIVRETTMLNDEWYWIRVSALEDFIDSDPHKSINALPSLATIRAQVILAQFKNNDNDLSHLAQALPAKTIGKLLTSQSAVKKVEQPFASYGGKLPENGTEFYRRVSERLRHGDRAIQIWDYERLILEKYPKVYRAKCLNHTSLNSELAPGYVTVAVIPDLRQRDLLDQPEPRFSFGDLEEIANYLRNKTNLFVAVQKEDKRITPEPLCATLDLVEPDAYLNVVNPTYEALRLEFSVAFHPKFDKEFHKLKLDDELKNFLAPWLTNSNAEISFGTTLFVSHILGFIESREYVDVVVDLNVYHAIDVDELKGENDRPNENCRVIGDQIKPTTSKSIITTFLDENKKPNTPDHIIHPFQR